MNRKIARKVPGMFTNAAVLITAILACVMLLLSCGAKREINPAWGIDYNNFKDSLLNEGKNESFDTTNIFESGIFIPGRDSVAGFIKKLDSLWKREQTFPANKSSFYWQNSMLINRSVLEAFFKSSDSKLSACEEKDCPLFAEISKPKQVLYLYLDGKLVDTFRVSTGVSGYETPNMSCSPSGPIFTRYTSRKFPGGDYKGLGNMPYAVFVKGGYAIHGTTPGNFSKLGSPASHGCIRLHPDNAKIFNELVKLVGLKNTWVTVRGG